MNDNNNKISKAIGIDLGTTNSCASVVIDGEVIILKNRNDEETTPSYVTFESDKKGNVTTVIGKASINQAVTHPKSTIFIFKRLMGKRYSEILELKKNVTYEIADDEGRASVLVNGKTLSPIYISGVYLQNLIQQIEEKSNYKIKDVVITVPANFNEAQRAATKQAGNIANLNVLRIISEPTAAAMSYSIKNNINGKVLVYDLGGGTFDVSILDVEDGVFDVIATGGDMNLGGEDFDNIIYNWAISEFEKKENVKIVEETILFRIKEESKKIKEFLSSSVTATMNVYYVAVGSKHMNFTIHRSWFEEAIKESIKKTIKITKEVLDKSNVTKIDTAILVGGSTKIGLIKKMLEAEFKSKNLTFNCDVNPDTAIAAGAAYQASILSGETKGIVLMDVTPLDIGIETVGGVVTPIINSNSKIPCTEKKTFTTAADNQSSVDIRIFQGNRPLVSQCKFLGDLKLSNIKPAPRGIPQVTIELGIDTNGLLTIKAFEQSSNVKNNLTITMSNDIKDEEILKMKQEAEEQKENDKEELKKIELTNECNNLAYELENRIKEVKDNSKKETWLSEVQEAKKDIDANAKIAKEKLQKIIEIVANYLSKQESENKDNTNPSSEQSSNQGSEENNSNSSEEKDNKEAK